MLKIMVMLSKLVKDVIMQVQAHREEKVMATSSDGGKQTKIGLGYILILLKRRSSMKNKMRMIETAIRVDVFNVLCGIPLRSFGNSGYSKSFLTTLFVYNTLLSIF